MTALEAMNVANVFKIMAAEWGCPVFMVKMTIRERIDESWEKSRSNPKKKALWDKYFPEGKPTPEQYILLIGNSQKKGQTVPMLLAD